VAKKITLDAVMKELKAIKRLILKDLQLDLEEDKLTKKEYKMLNKKTIFKDIEEWKEHIWDECQHKITKYNKKEVDYFCGVLKDDCNFEHCPLNIKK